MARRAWGEGSTFFDATKKRWTWKGTYLLNGIKKPKTLTAKRQIDLKKKVDRFKLMVDEGYYADVYTAVFALTTLAIAVFLGDNIRLGLNVNLVLLALLANLAFVWARYKIR